MSVDQGGIEIRGGEAGKAKEWVRLVEKKKKIVRGSPAKNTGRKKRKREKPATKKNRKNVRLYPHESRLATQGTQDSK